MLKLVAWQFVCEYCNHIVFKIFISSRGIVHTYSEEMFLGRDRCNKLCFAGTAGWISKMLHCCCGQRRLQSDAEDPHLSAWHGW